MNRELRLYDRLSRTVFAVFGVTFHHLIPALEARQSHIQNRVLLVARLLRRKERGIGSERKVDAGESTDAVNIVRNG